MSNQFYNANDLFILFPFVWIERIRNTDSVYLTHKILMRNFRFKAFAFCRRTDYIRQVNA
jgi:hypothetical protein